MRLSDSPSVTIETRIGGSADRIYDLISDLDVMASFGTEFQGGEWVSGRAGTVGSSFKGRQKLGDLEWESTSTIVAAEPGRKFAWSTGDPDEPFTTWTFSLVPAPRGTDVSFSFVHGPGESGLAQKVEANPDEEETIIEERLDVISKNMVTTLEGLRRRVES